MKQLIDRKRIISLRLKELNLAFYKDKMEWVTLSVEMKEIDEKISKKK